MSSGLEKTARHWDAHHEPGARVQWWDLPAVVRYRNALLSGDPDVGFEEHISSRYLAPVEGGARILSLGCGAGAVERRLFSLGYVASGVGVDIGPRSLEIARERAAAGGIQDLEYRYGDLNRLQLEADSFDAVVSAGILHHLSDLEHVLDQVAASLRPGGVLLVDEYVGPNRFQFPPSQRAAIDAAFADLPEDLRRPAGPAAAGPAVPVQALGPRLLWSKLRSGRFLDAVRYRLSRLKPGGEGVAALSRPRLPTAADVAHGDPSEAVRSEEILPLLRDRFEVVEERGTGLGLLQFLLADIAANFLDPTRADELEGLIARERELTDAGTVPHDFVFVAAKKRG